jgi:hypothetical protein
LKLKFLWFMWKQTNRVRKNAGEIRVDRLYFSFTNTRNPTDLKIFSLLISTDLLLKKLSIQANKLGERSEPNVIFEYVAFASAIVYLVSRGSLTKRSGQFLVSFRGSRQRREEFSFYPNLFFFFLHRFEGLLIVPSRISLNFPN